MLTLAIAAQAQSKKQPPPPPPPPPPVEMTNDVPPPPPPPPVPPVKDGEKTIYPKDYQDFLDRNPSVSAVRWQDNAIVIERKDGKTERYVLDENGTRQAEARYGKLPAPPPPPPMPPKPPVAPKPPVPPRPRD